MKNSLKSTLFLMSVIQAQVGFNGTGTLIETGLIDFNAVVVDAQNNSIAVGETRTNKAVIKIYNCAGSLMKTIISNNLADYYAVAVDLQGRIIAAGNSNAAGEVIEIYTHNGSLVATINETSNNDTDPRYYNGIAIDSDNRIVLVGDTLGTRAGFIKVYKSDTSVDASFNTDDENPGQKVESTDDNDVVSYNSVAIDSDNRIIAVGETHSGTGIISIYASNGNLIQKIVESDGDNDPWYYNGVTTDQQNRIIAVGETHNAKGIIKIYSEAGMLVKTILTGSAGTDPWYYNEVTVDKCQRIIASGSTIDGFGITAIYDSTGNFITKMIDNNTGQYFGVATDSEHKIIVSGITTGGNAFISRYFAHGDLDSVTNWNSKVYWKNCKLQNKVIGLF